MSNTEDQGHEDSFSDPTAPAPDPGGAQSRPSDPTQPVPTDPGTGQPWTPPEYHQAPPGETGYDQPTYGQPTYDQPTYGQPTYEQAPYGQPTYGQGYGQQPPSTPYPVPYQPGYGAQPGYPTPYSAPPGGYPSSPTNGSAIALTVVSGVTVLFCGGLFVIPALVMGIVALTKQGSDPFGSRRLSRNGWWAYAAGVAVTVLLVIAFFAFVVSASTSVDTSFQGY